MQELVKEAAAVLHVTPRALLGEGSYAQVWRATRNRETYCLKVWFSGTLEEQGEHDALLRRAETLGFSDFMPRLLGSVWGATLMEYRPGVELGAWAQTASLEARREVAEKCIRFVKRMEDAKYDHGDLSPNNALVGEGNVVTIIDPHGPRTCSNMTGLTNLILPLLG